MTRAQRRTHWIVFRGLALFFVVAIGFALLRRSVTAHSESAPLGHTRLHDAPVSP